MCKEDNKEIKKEEQQKTILEDDDLFIAMHQESPAEIQEDFSDFEQEEEPYPTNEDTFDEYDLGEDGLTEIDHDFGN